MRRAVFTAAALIALGLGVSYQQGLVAQMQPKADAQMESVMFSVSIVQVKPEMLTDWQEFQKNETIPALQKAGAKWRDAWTTGIFGEGFQYAFITPIDKFAQYDNPQSPIQRALGQEGARAYGAKNRRFISGTHTYAIQAQPALSYMPDPNMTPKLAVLTEVTVAPGRAADFEAYIKNDLLPLYKKVQAPYSVARTVFGGNVAEFTTVRYINSFADLDQGPVTVRVLGQAGADKLSAKVAGLTTSTTRSIIRYVPDLSFRVKTTSQAQ